jgi:hypothetical protein
VKREAGSGKREAAASSNVKTASWMASEAFNEECEPLVPCSLLTHCAHTLDTDQPHVGIEVLAADVQVVKATASGL